MGAHVPCRALAAAADAPVDAVRMIAALLHAIAALFGCGSSEDDEYDYE